MKQFLSLILIAILSMALLSACGTKGEGSDSADSGGTVSVSSTEKTDVSTDTESTDTSEKKPTRPDPSTVNRTPTAETDMVFACDQNLKKVVVYDMATYDGKNLDNNVVWSHSPGASIAGLRYRENTVFGNVVVLCGGGGFASIVSYRGADVIWKTTSSAGNNPHSVEILPDGNLVVASSTGNTLRLFHTSLLLEDPKNMGVGYKEYTFEDAHGVLWDPKYQVLWALGINELAAFKVVGTGVNAELVRAEGMGGTLPSQYGHALAADFQNADALWLSTGSHVYHFDKTTNTFSTDYLQNRIVNRSAIKGFGNNPNGNFFFTFPNGGPGRTWAGKSIAEWCTDTIGYIYTDENGNMKLRNCVSQRGAYYKVVPFYGEYQ